MRVSIEQVLEIQRQREMINKVPLDDIIWTENGKDLVIPPEVVVGFTFTGLNNTDFIIGQCYKRKEWDLSHIKDN